MRIFLTCFSFEGTILIDEARERARKEGEIYGSWDRARLDENKSRFDG